MAEIGSFALLLALALSVYTFVAGIVALAFQKRIPEPSPSSRRASPASAEGGWRSALRRGSANIGETARRAGIATFAAVFLAAVVLVLCAFRPAFNNACIFHVSNHRLCATYKF